MISDSDRITELEEQLANANEELFLAQSDLKQAQVLQVELMNFIQNIYESCDQLEEDQDLSELLKNLKENIRVFAKVNRIRL